MAFIPDEAIDRMYSDLTSGARDLYTFLCRCRNQVNGKCCPSVSTTQDALKLSRARVFALRKELSTKGWAEFDGNNAIQLFGFASLKNKTVHELAKEDTGIAADSLENKTTEIEESQKQDSPSLEIETDNVETAKVVEFSAKSLKNETSPHDKTESLENKTESLENETLESQKQDLHIGRTSKENQQRRTSKDTSGECVIPKSEGKKSSRKKTQPPKSEFHNHPSVVAYREELEFYALKAAQADLIAEVIGLEAEAAPPEWLKFLRELAESGTKHAHNVRVMVSAFTRYKANMPLGQALSQAWDEAQGRTNGGMLNGKTQTGKAGLNGAAKVGSVRTTEDDGIRTPQRI